MKVSLVPSSLTLAAVVQRVNPAASSSMVVTRVERSPRESNASSEPASTTATATAVTRLPSASLSSTPVAVTTCSVDQLSVVKVSVAGATVASPVSELVTESTTSVAGCASSTAVNVVVEPASVTAASALDTVNPAVSSSVVITDTSTSIAPSKALSDDPSTVATITVDDCSPSSSRSSTPMSATVCSVDQSVLVKVSVEGQAITSPASLLVTESTTSDVGAVPREMVMAALEPASVTMADVEESEKADGIDSSERPRERLAARCAARVAGP